MVRKADFKIAGATSIPAEVTNAFVLMRLLPMNHNVFQDPFMALPKGVKPKTLL